MVLLNHQETQTTFCRAEANSEVKVAFIISKLALSCQNKLVRKTLNYFCQRKHGAEKRKGRSADRPEHTENLVLRLRILRGVEGIWRNIHMLQYGAYNIPEYRCRDASAEVVACGGVVNHNH